MVDNILLERYYSSIFSTNQNSYNIKNNPKIYTITLFVAKV